MTERIRIDPSTTHVRVEVDGVVVADSKQARILREASLRPRYYLPADDVRMDLLTPTASQTHCPYKGDAEYWSVTVDGQTYSDLVWSYRNPVPESQDIAGLLCFYDEKADVYLDGELQSRA